MSQESSERAQSFQAWKRQPETRAFFNYLEAKREELKELWADGSFTAAFDVEMAVKNSGAASVAGFCKELVNLDEEDLESYYE